jgi:DNA-directed RNA polymerase subunit RPC12/RpoP
MIVFPCHVCQTPLCAEPKQAGQLVRCPTCSTTLHVPANPNAMVAAAATRTANVPSRLSRGYSGLIGPQASGKRYGFNCAYCSSRLEATQAMAAQDGQCPTCGKQITIPILDRYGRLIDPSTRQIIKQDPHPVHAYAAAGDRAPKILRLADRRQAIICPRCQVQSPIAANNCKACGMPFTMEGTTVEAAGASNGFCVASLVLGIIAIPAALTLILPVLALVFGVIGYTQVNRNEGDGGGKGLAIAGMICGGVGCFIAVAYNAKNLF